MLIGSNRGAGMNIGAPDVCLTPVGPAVVPIPYPNFALNAQAVPFSPIVRLSMVNALNQGSTIPVTFGDDPGVAHPTFKGTGMYTMGNPVVYVDNLPAVNLCCPTTGNNMNDGVGMVAVPSATNVFYTLACLAEPGEAGVARDGGGRAAGGGGGRSAGGGGGRAAGGGDGRAAGGEPAEPGSAPVTASMLAAIEQALSTPLVGEGVLIEDSNAECDGAGEGAASVGVVTIGAFSFDLPTRAHNAIERLVRAGARALVLDLRGCPGGELDACLRLAGDFLDRGLEIARVVDAAGDEIVHRARQDGPRDLPLALVVDGGTASAAEVLAACLQAHGRAVVVGERTRGKGTAQQILPSERGSRCLTTAVCARPGGQPIDGVGVTPDIPAAREEALSAAVRALRGRSPSAI